MKKTDVLLLVPSGINYNTPPLGLLYLAAVLEKNAVSVSILDAGLEGLTLDQTFRKIEEISPRVIGITICTPDYPLIDKFIFLLKKKMPQLSVVTGGPHATLDPEGILSTSRVDYVIRGEGEYSFLELCNAILKNRPQELSGILGLSFRENGKIKHNPARPLIENLDDIPMAARHLVPLMKYRNYGRIYKRFPVGVMITSRGCPMQCIFCAHEIFGRRYRFMSAARVIEEIKHLQKAYGVKEILFREDNFTANRDRVFDICDRIIKEKLDISWMCLADVNSITEEMAVKMKQAGCWHIGLGVESGNDRILKILKKGISLKKTLEVFKFIHKAGIRTLAFFMIGNYSDTRETVKDTIDFARKLDTDFAIFTITTPFPGTELFDLAVKNNLVTNFDYGSLTNNPLIFKQKVPILRTFSLSPDDLRKLQLQAICKFYLRPGQLFRILSHKSLARAFLNIQPSSYSPNAKIIRDIEERYAHESDG